MSRDCNSCSTPISVEVECIMGWTCDMHVANCYLYDRLTWANLWLLGRWINASPVADVTVSTFSYQIDYSRFFLLSARLANVKLCYVLLPPKHFIIRFGGFAEHQFVDRQFSLCQVVLSVTRSHVNKQITFGFRLDCFCGVYPSDIWNSLNLSTTWHNSLPFEPAELSKLCSLWFVYFHLIRVVSFQWAASLDDCFCIMSAIIAYLVTYLLARSNRSCLLVYFLCAACVEFIHLHFYNRNLNCCLFILSSAFRRRRPATVYRNISFALSVITLEYIFCWFVYCLIC